MSEDGEYEPSEDNTNYKAISCEQIPELFLDKLVAKNHFGKFGKINRFILRPKRLSCTVEYETEEDAERAFLEAGSYNSKDFIINYAEHEVAHVQNTEEWVDPDVQAELDAMSPGHRYGSSLRSATVLTAQSLQKGSALSRVAKSSTGLPVPQKTAKPEVPKIDASVRNELESILRRPAFTDEDKYRVLEARDKLIRLTTIRQTDISKAVATRGYCPDMCPEKERLMREFQRQVSTFEMADEEGSQTTISQTKAIKEYSRSSADQEVPLSHELRSESVLQMTMLYLMHRIMDLCDDPQTSLGDWFHFVWDRTRSIRKDITQQELCSLGAVQLVEQCARFHIHCAARLVAEDPSVFDKKINAENLTKCLQTLKYIYHDLRIKGVQCPCEGEFRSYIILLNLGDSNFLWEVKQLPESIQKSAEIKRAIAFYNALQNNNYVKFFSMIKSPETSYLSACILLGYFTKLRVRAMEAIVKSHNWRKNDVFLPLSYLTRILGFDDEYSAGSFFNHHGLQCDVLDDRVLLERLTRPDMEYAMDRALQLVESKRQVSVGQCIFGQRLPSSLVFEEHEPHCSFDANGILKTESWTAEDQLRGEAAKLKATEIKQHHPIPVQPPSSNDIKFAEKNIFKKPQVVSISPKQQRTQEVQQQQPPQKSIFGSFSSNNEDTRSSSPSSFKFGGNIFGGTTTTTAPPPKPSVVNGSDSIFKLSATTEKRESKENNYLNTIFQPIPENPSTTTGNIFGGVAKYESTNSTNIFGVAAKETANIFQEHGDAVSDPFKKDSVFQHFHSKPDMFSFDKFSNETTSPLTEPKKTQEVDMRREIERRKLELEREHGVKQKLIDEEKRKLKQLEERHLREKQQEQELRLREVEKKRREQLEEHIKQKADQEHKTLVNKIISEEVEKIAEEEILRFQILKQATSQQTDLLISEVVQAYVEDIAHEEYALMCHDQLLLNRYFARWLLHLRKKKVQRKLMESTPLWVTTSTRSQYATALEHPCQDKNLKMIKRYRLGQPCDFKQLLNMGQYNVCEDNQNPLNLFALVGQHLLIKRHFTPSGLLQQRKYFKFIISLPADHEESLGFESFSNKWLIRFIEKSQIEKGPFVHGMERNVSLCVRKLAGISPKNEQGDYITTETDHNDGIVCFISGIEIEKHSRKRLHNLLNKSKNYKRIPLVIIAYNCHDFCREELEEMLDLNSLQEEGLIHSFLILGCQVTKKKFSFRKMLIEAVNFITQESYALNSNDIQALAMQNVFSFFEAALGEEIWQRWWDSANTNPILNKICSLPLHVKGIYHKALDHLLHIIQEDLSEMPEFPDELREFVPQTSSLSNIPLGLEYFSTNWKDPKRVETIKQVIKKLYLPDIKEQLPRNVDDLELWILNYASQCITDDDMAATRASYEAIENLINQLKQQDLQQYELPSRINNLNYLSVLKPIIFAHINHTIKKISHDLINLNVIYLKNDFDNYQSQPWWLNYQPLDLVCVDYNEKPITLPLEAENNDKENQISFGDIDGIIAKAEATSLKAAENLSSLKTRKSLKCQNSSGSSLLLKRTLDESLYQFELSKQCGHYDTSFVDDLTEDIDKSIDHAIHPSSQPAGKRKRYSTKSPGKCSDIDAVIAKAMSLIEKVDSMEDHKERVKKSNKLYSPV